MIRWVHASGGSGCLPLPPRFELAGTAGPGGAVTNRQHAFSPVVSGAALVGLLSAGIYFDWKNPVSMRAMYLSRRSGETLP